MVVGSQVFAQFRTVMQTALLELCDIWSHLALRRSPAAHFSSCPSADDRMLGCPVDVDERGFRENAAWTVAHDRRSTHESTNDTKIIGNLASVVELSDVAAAPE